MLFKQYFLLFFCLLGPIATSQAQTTAMTFNIRYDNPSDGENAWEKRKPEVLALINSRQPDFLALQEVLPGQLGYLQEHLKGYQFIGYGRDGKNTDSEATPIFYNSSKFELVGQEVFWLSETPEEVSKGWDAALNRTTVYGKFRNVATGEVIHIINTHFDHQGKTARLRSAKLLSGFLESENLTDEKVILMGDFNASPDEAPIQMLNSQLTDAREVEGISVTGPKGTFNGFDTERSSFERIDYIFIKNLEVKAFECVDKKRTNGLYPSDHFPLLIKF